MIQTPFRFVSVCAQRHLPALPRRFLLLKPPLSRLARRSWCQITLTGTYINLTNGANNPSPPSGWNFNPYSSGGDLDFYWSGAGLSQNMGVSTGSGSDIYADLAPGTVIGAASNFIRLHVAGTAPIFCTTGIHILGFQFVNSRHGCRNYGYAFMQTTATTGFPATVLSWSYEDSGAAITVVPEPSTNGAAWSLRAGGRGNRCACVASSARWGLVGLPVRLF